MKETLGGLLLPMTERKQRESDPSRGMVWCGSEKCPEYVIVVVDVVLVVAYDLRW